MRTFPPANPTQRLHLALGTVEQAVYRDKFVDINLWGPDRFIRHMRKTLPDFGETCTFRNGCHNTDSCGLAEGRVFAGLSPGWSKIEGAVWSKAMLSPWVLMEEVMKYCRRTTQLGMSRSGNITFPTSAGIPLFQIFNDNPEKIVLSEPIPQSFTQGPNPSDNVVWLLIYEAVRNQIFGINGETGQPLQTRCPLHFDSSACEHEYVSVFLENVRRHIV